MLKRKYPKGMKRSLMKNIFKGNVIFRRGIFGVIDFPTIIKIDVDGLESKILEGAQSTLRDRRLKRLIVEFDSQQDADLEVLKFEKLGFILDSLYLIAKDGSGCKNYHFRRE